MFAEKSPPIVLLKEGDRITAVQILNWSARSLCEYGENADMQMVTSLGDESSAAMCLIGGHPIGVLALSNWNQASSVSALFLVDADKGELPKSISMKPWILNAPSTNG